MTTPPAFAAELLRASSRALAGTAAARLLEESPEIQQRFGHDAFELWRAHLAAQIDDLAMAVAEEDPQVFVRQLRWFRSAAASRELPAEDLSAALDALEHCLRERLPQVPATLWDPVFRDAATALQGPAAEAAVALAPGSHAASFLDAVLRGESRAARALAVDLVASGAMSAAQLVEDVLLPVQRESGRRWHVGELGIAEEHVVTATVRTALADLASGAPVPAADAPGAIVAAVSGDAHDLALHALASLLEDDGWRVSMAGADTPAIDLAQSCVHLRTDLVVLSATLVSQRHALRVAIEDLRAVPGFELPILVGGAAIRDGEMARDLGADGFAATLAAAVGEADRLVGR